MQVDTAIHPAVSSKAVRGANRPDAQPPVQESRPNQALQQETSPRGPAAAESPRPVPSVPDGLTPAREVVMTREIEARGMENGAEANSRSVSGAEGLNEALDRAGTMREEADPGQLIDARA